MIQFLLILTWLLLPDRGFALGPLDPSALSWIKSLNTETSKLIDEYKAEVSKITEPATQSPALKRPLVTDCPSTVGCKTSENFETFLKSHTQPHLAEQNPKQIPQLLVFVSFSMQKETLKSLAQSLKQVGGALVFCGLVNDSFKDTGKAFEVLGEEALIDPTLFRAHQVTRVPTFVLRQAQDEFPPLLSQVPLTFDQLSGNVTLDYALSQFAEKGEVKGARELLAQLRGQK
ncbi:MAG: type-F conjugative transfer system pilin assembly protein TrbC [Alphaproteobacteria bacterium]|nr:type-F conjugative transfer system pilin assembly protein TrbC [Alphaproteobacteria bacterium]